MILYKNDQIKMRQFISKRYYCEKMHPITIDSFFYIMYIILYLYEHVAEKFKCQTASSSQ